MAGELILRETPVREYEHPDNQRSIPDIYAGVTRANFVPRWHRDDAQGAPLFDVAEADVGNLQFNNYFSLVQPARLQRQKESEAISNRITNGNRMEIEPVKS